MKITHRSLPRTVLALTTLILAAAAVAPPTQGGTPALAVRAVTTQGCAVTITIANLTTEALRGTVLAQVSTTEGATLVAAPVSVQPEGTASVTVDAAAPVTGVLPLGVVLDDGVPF
jgi:hypothetical protein